MSMGSVNSITITMWSVSSISISMMTIVVVVSIAIVGIVVTSTQKRITIVSITTKVSGLKKFVLNWYFLFSSNLLQPQHLVEDLLLDSEPWWRQWWRQWWESGTSWLFRFALVWFSPFGRLVPSPRLASNLYKLDVALKFPRIEISSSLEISASLPVLCCNTRSPQYADVVTISGQPAINS